MATTTPPLADLVITSLAPARRRVAGASRPRRRLFEIRRALPMRFEILAAVVACAALLGVWTAIVELGYANAALFPAPHRVVLALCDLIANDGFLGDIGTSTMRIGLSFAAACLLALPLGVLMGAFPVVEAFINPLVAPARYLPAPSFIPLLLMWFGTGEMQKLALLFLGVVWFLITLVMDATKTARIELMEAARTLGANRRQVLLRVIVPEVLPGLVTAMRQMLAVSWTYLVIAEIVAATDGIGAMMMRAKRFIRTDDIMAGIVTIGLLGLAADLLFRLAHRLMFPYLYRKN